MTLDLPGRHASRLHGDDLLVEARKPPLIPGDQLRVERAFPIARNTQGQLGILGQHRLLRMAIAVIGLARRRLAIEMVVQFRVQDALGQRFLQLVEKPILGKHLLRIAPRQKLVQRALLDRHSPPPAASLWPHTQDSRQSLCRRKATSILSLGCPPPSWSPTAPRRSACTRRASASTTTSSRLRRPRSSPLLRTAHLQTDQARPCAGPFHLSLPSSFTTARRSLALS